MPASSSRPKRCGKHYTKAIGKGVLKVMSKMGIPPISPIAAPRFFDARGPFPRPSSRKYSSPHRIPVEGVGLLDVAEECVERHNGAYGDIRYISRWRSMSRQIRLPLARRGSRLDADSIAKLQHAVRGNFRGRIPGVCARHQRWHPTSSCPARADEFKPARACAGARRCEPASEIVKSFATRRHGASVRSAPRGAHLARIAMEPDRSALQHREGGGGIRALQRPLAKRRIPPARASSSRVGPLRASPPEYWSTPEKSNQDGQGAKPGEAASFPAEVDKAIAQGAPFDAGRRPISPRRITTSIPSKTSPSSFADLKSVKHAGAASRSAGVGSGRAPSPAGRCQMPRRSRHHFG